MFSCKLCGHFVSHSALYSFYKSEFVSGTGLLRQALLFQHIFWYLHYTFLPFMRVNECKGPDLNWNSCLRFLILCRYVLHHSHTHAYNTWYSQVKVLTRTLLNFSDRARTSDSKWYGRKPGGKWQGWLACNKVLQPINQHKIDRTLHFRLALYSLISGNERCRLSVEDRSST